MRRLSLLVATLAIAGPACRRDGREVPETRRSLPAVAPVVADGPAYWRQWRDSTCGAYSTALASRLPQLPDSIKPTVTPDDPPHFAGFGDYYHPEGPLGAGILTSGVQGVEGAVPAWPCGVFLPLYGEPQGIPQAWLVAGRLARRGVSWTMPLNDMPVIRTGQSENAWLVHEVRGDGWFRVRMYWPGAHVGDGTWWAHTSQVSLGAVPLRLIPWEAYLLNRPWPLVVFRDRGSHRLYARPDTSSEAISLAALEEYGLRALEVRGDWMRVHRQKDSGFCTDPRKPTPSDTGWIVWRTRERGSLLWVEAWDC